MSTHHERRVEILARRVRARTKHDGTPLPGFEQNVASLRAEMEIINERIEFNRAAIEADGDETNGK
jgi:hypothetical protein